MISVRDFLTALRRFSRMQASGGLLLIAAALLAIAVANGPLAGAYFGALDARLGPLTLHHWINDGLMSLFFLTVGLEIKRECVKGRLARWRDRALPVIAAVGGMAAPAAVYMLIAGGEPGLARGWAIPAATNIAFAIGVLALAGRRVPASLALLLATIAIVDDMGAVLIIALGYTQELNGGALAVAGLLLAAMLLLGRAGVGRLTPYMLLAGGLWLAVLLSGVHATVAGVLTALAIPLRRPDDGGPSPLERLDRRLHPWVAFLIVPLFGFANAGVSLAGVGAAQLATPLPLGVAAGLFIGKQLGISASIALAIALGLGARPAGASWMQIHGMALLCGIGFTMSLFIGGLAFADPHMIDAVKIGVLGGSVLSALCGYLVLRFAPAARAR